MSDLLTALAKIAELEAKNLDLEARVAKLEAFCEKKQYQTWRGKEDEERLARERDGV